VRLRPEQSRAVATEASCMVRGKSQVFRVGLSALWYSGVARAASRWTAGKGAVLMLHRVQPAAARAFAPNARLRVTPRYLAALLASLRAADIDVISLDEALTRLHATRRTRRFVCFTFDDGYRDNLEHALPVFRRFGAPFTVFATPGFADRTLAPWWDALEVAIARASEVRWDTLRFDTTRLAGKRRAFAALSARCFALTAAQLALRLPGFLAEHGLDMRAVAERELCSWDELRILRAAGVEIGCHTATHARLSLETEAGVEEELASARRRLEVELGRPVRHLAYPYGKREHVGPREVAMARRLGFACALTTRPGVLRAEHATQRHALPRVEVTPAFEASPHYMQTILTGLPLALRGFGR
jgi:peptidoglycan/xylan/chitin deacetylase (PgdA/CDA1 family)